MSLSARVRRAPVAILSALAVVATGLIAAAPAQAVSEELFFSEYVEGSSNNKALEIHNGTGALIDLAAAGYSVQMFFNGSSSAGLTINLTGSVADGDVYVVAQSLAAAAILAEADQTQGSGWFNGDDAITLRHGSTVVDSIGQAGVDPGTEWGTGLTSTADNTLRRMAAVTDGDTDSSDAFDPSLEWDGFATDTFDGLGSHEADVPTGPAVVVSRVYGGGGNSGATLKNDYIELFNRGDAPASLDGWSVQYASAAGNFNVGTALTGTLDPGQYFLVQEGAGAGGSTDLPAPDATGNILMSATNAKVALVSSGSALSCGSTDAPCSEEQRALIVDLVGYGSANMFEGSAAAPTLSNTSNALRLGNGCTDTDDNAADFTTESPEATPRNTSTALNPCDGPPGDAAPAVASTTPATGAVDVTPDADVNLTFSEPVALAADPATISCSVSNGHTYALSGSDASYTLNPDADFAFSETCTVTVAAAKVTDVDSDDPPNEMAADHVFSFQTMAPPPECTDADTPISAVQGPGDTSPVVGTVVTVQAVVTAIRPGLTGLFIQEEGADQDASDATSEGIFVRTFSPPAGLAAGDVAQVTGGVREFTPNSGPFSSQTQISDTVTVLDCGDATVPAPGVLEFPVTDVTDFEHFEGMRVTMPQPLVISEYFNFARFNEVVVGVPPNGRSRFDTPTAVQEPNVAATTALLADYAKRRITIDDGRSSQNSSPPVFPGTVDTPFTLNNTFRGGDTLTGTTGVVEHTFGLYRVHPTEDAAYASVNPRPTDPPVVGGDIKVGSFNVLNYFVTIDRGPDICGGGQDLDCRGADDEEELQRQRAKIVDAIARLDADVVGLMEMENTPGAEPAADLVDGLNDATAPGTYDYIDTGVIGTDAIRLGFLYKPGTVTPAGDFAVLDSDVDPRFDDTRSRPALAQTFEQVGTAERITVAVNHLKSKGSECDGDPDTGDGSGNCNLTRTLAAEALADWLETDPTNSGDPDHLIIGDLNSYDYEAPIDALRAAGYTDLVKRFGGEFAYGYVFDGLVGYLDHALANEPLNSQVTGAAEWHINADEPGILDYDTRFKGPAEDALYEPNAFRSSDHDAVLVGVELGVTQCQFSDDAATSTRTLLNDCETSHSVLVPDGWTLDGAGHSITAVDPSGGHFTGAVVRNAGLVANVRNLTVTADDLADVCDAGDDRLRGIMLDGAAGSIVGNHVLGINQGDSGCQEGNAIEVRNAPFDTTGVDKVVTVSDNEVSDYQKGGIVANGSVRVTIVRNTVQGVGPVDYIAQNGIQIAFGATGLVESNSMTNNFYTGPDVACGLLFFEADGAKQKRNTFAGNEKDVCNFGRGGGGVSASR